MSARPATISAAVATWFCEELKEERPYSRPTRPNVDNATEGASNFERFGLP